MRRDMKREGARVLFEPEDLRKDNPTLWVEIPGIGDCCSEDGHGAAVLVERWDGEWRVVVWADINQEDPTHIVSLSGAAETKRERMTRRDRETYIRGQIAYFDHLCKQLPRGGRGPEARYYAHAHSAAELWREELKKLEEDNG